MFGGMFDVCNATLSNIIDKIRKLQTKMAAKEVAMVVILSELADSDDEKPTRGPTRSWIKRRKENGFFETIFKELILEDWKVLLHYKCFLNRLFLSFLLNSSSLEGLSPVAAIFKDKSIFLFSF